MPNKLEGLQKFGQVNNKFLSNSILQLRQNKNMTSQLNDNYQPIDIAANEYSHSITHNNASNYQKQPSPESMAVESSNSFKMGFSINEQVQKQIVAQPDKNQVTYK